MRKTVNEIVAMLEPFENLEGGEESARVMVEEVIDGYRDRAGEDGKLRRRLSPTTTTRTPAPRRWSTPPHPAKSTCPGGTHPESVSRRRLSWPRTTWWSRGR